MTQNIENRRFSVNTKNGKIDLIEDGYIRNAIKYIKGQDPSQNGFTNNYSQGHEPVILHDGSGGSSFKALTVTGPHVDYIQVNSYEEKKSFVYYTSFGFIELYTGTCIYKALGD